MRSLILPRLPSQMQSTKSAQIYKKLITKCGPHPQPHKFVRSMMDAFKTLKPKPDRSIHGRYFEYVIGETLAQAGIRHLYFQAEVRHVPLAIFDWFLYHPKYPVSISCKTKARDRWKQAAFEAKALKQVYTQALNYLVTMEELSSIDTKKEDAPQTIDHFVIATKPEYSEAVKQITSHNFIQAEKVSPIIKDKLLTLATDKD